MDSKILEKVEKVITDIHCCNACLGRQFGNLLSGLTNYSRGIALKIIVLMEWEHRYRIQDVKATIFSSLLSKDFDIGIKSLQRHFPDVISSSKPCDICHDLLLADNLDQLTQKAFISLKEYEYSTFLVGSIFPPVILDSEDNIRSSYNLEFGESIKAEFNREIGKRLQSLVPNVIVEFKAPDIVVTYDLIEDKVLIKSNPLFILGRYRKLERGIPQSRWFCRKCRGKGCERCNFTGKMYQDSVEEFISEPFLLATNASSSKFHGAGREDIDARMVGTGRPFVLEISEPRIRNVNLDQLKIQIEEKALGKVEVEFKGFTNRAKVRELKTRSTKTAKAYRAQISLNPPIEITETLKKGIIKNFQESIIKQRTPHRVVHRRADKIRDRRVITFRFEHISPQEITVFILCEGGLYVKELISGDEGRTTPSLSMLLNTQAIVTKLDVIEVLEPSNSLLSTNPAQSD
ncbi:tRNA pseudouridine(54/55) synthase Pus10 [Candidatus Hodarchaeum mangrovi]